MQFGAGRGEQAVARLFHWPSTVLRLVVKYQQSPLRAARSLSYVHVAMHDAWLHATRARLDAGCAELAAHRAASLVLEQLYPNETPGQFEAQFQGWTATLADSPDAMASRCAEAVAHQLLQRSLTDGSGRVWAPRMRPAAFPGMWQPTFPMFAANPAEGLAPSWRPWVPASKDRHDPPVAARPGSEAHANETREVLEVARSLTPGQRRLAEDWNLDAGSVTPAGVWMQIAMRELQLAVRSVAPHEATDYVLSASASVAVAMHDAFLACWRVKMRDWSERPITAIRRSLDPGFAPPIVTPGFPSYVSGHATVSAAAATVLAHAIPARAEHFRQLAREAAMSRLWGGIHFRSDNEEGLRLGDSVGRDVLKAREA